MSPKMLMAEGYEKQLAISDVKFRRKGSKLWEDGVMLQSAGVLIVDMDGAPLLSHEIDDWKEWFELRVMARGRGGKS